MKKKIPETFVVSRIFRIFAANYDTSIMTREELKRLPERTELFGGGRSASVTKGEFTYWCDTSIERDIYNVDAHVLMKALNVETLDVFFKVINERFSFDTLEEFLKENNIHYAAYGF